MSHLRDENLSWFRHCKFAWSLSFILMRLSITALIHGLFPFWFVYNVSDRIKHLSKMFGQEDLSKYPH